MTTWHVSGGWLRAAHDCTLAGIKLRCGGGCCVSNGQPWWWPASAAGVGQPTPCHYLGDEGCTLTMQDRPVTCLLFPLRPNKNGTWVNQRLSVFEHGVCQGNHGRGPALIDALRDQLVSLFGAEEYERARASVMAGGDADFEVPDDVAAAYAAEVVEAAVLALPPPRTSR